MSASQRQILTDYLRPLRPLRALRMMRSFDTSGHLLKGEAAIPFFLAGNQRRVLRPRFALYMIAPV